MFEQRRRPWRSSTSRRISRSTSRRRSTTARARRGTVSWAGISGASSPMVRRDRAHPSPLSSLPIRLLMSWRPETKHFIYFYLGHCAILLFKTQ